MVQMIHAYMSVAPSTEIKFDLYSKLSKLSGSFKELLGKANVPQGQLAMAGGAVATVDAVDVTPAPVPVAAAAKPTFCGECGAKNDAGTKFCGECGKAL
jgi:membrane protease subunit (stomatin/prohibitin family)